MTETSYCSWCFEHSTHSLFERNYLQRNVYRCESCRNLTVECRYCKSMATAKPNPDEKDWEAEGFLNGLKSSWHSELCAEHDGTIASFERLGDQFDELEDYGAYFERDSFNLKRAATTGAFALAAATVVAPLAVMGGPAVAAAAGKAGLLGAAGTGTAIATLNGAALTSASMAAIGGGAVAGGVTIMTAAGAALGAQMGGVVSNSYFGSIKDFAIRKHNEGDGPAIIFVNGFLTQKSPEVKDWKRSLRGRFNDSPWYHVDWESKNLARIGKGLAASGGWNAAQAYALRLAKAGAVNAADLLNPLGWASTFKDILSNPWHSAMVKASMTGVLLADLMARTKDTEFVLMGHSLGARVIYYALEALSTKPDRPVVRDVYLMGGAVGRDDREGWRHATGAVSGTIHNFYSDQDDVLRLLYRTANLNFSAPIGSGPIEYTSGRIANYDASELVGGHTKWKGAFPDLLGLLPDDGEPSAPAKSGPARPRRKDNGRYASQAYAAANPDRVYYDG